ncbi:MAG: YbhB/YbcL family Raf kinase inhibitor-like protein, partial [Patescibacteria group bacterium]
MRRPTIVVVACLALLGAGCGSPFTVTPVVTPTPYSPMSLSSTAFQDGGFIPVEYTCDGKGISPPLTISDAPAGIKSFVLTLEDPDAPGGTFDHWVLFNIPSGTTTLAEGDATGTAGTNGAGKVGYVALCPPSGTHHYVFTLYALDTTLRLTSNAKKADVLGALKPEIVFEAQLTG